MNNLKKSALTLLALTAISFNDINKDFWKINVPDTYFLKYSGSLKAEYDTLNNILDVGLNSMKNELSPMFRDNCVCSYRSSIDMASKVEEVFAIDDSGKKYKIEGNLFLSNINMKKINREKNIYRISITKNGYIQGIKNTIYGQNDISKRLNSENDIEFIIYYDRNKDNYHFAELKMNGIEFYDYKFHNVPSQIKDKSILLTKKVIEVRDSIVNSF